VEYRNPLPKRIGLVADSHDRLESLSKAIGILEERGAEALVHLGDICDSLRLDLLEDSVRLLRKHRMLVVKGNNDFMLENLLRCQPPENEGRFDHLAAFLRELPMKIVWDGVCFAHSLPFDHLRSFYEPIDMGSTERAEEIFRLTNHRILFCGHSHRSVLFRLSDGAVSRESLPDEQPISLDRQERYIIVTGSVLEGECAFFDVDAWSVENIRIP
jgi:hypothetical protein